MANNDIAIYEGPGGRVEVRVGLLTEPKGTVDGNLPSVSEARAALSELKQNDRAQGSGGG